MPTQGSDLPQVYRTYIALIPGRAAWHMSDRDITANAGAGSTCHSNLQVRCAALEGSRECLVCRGLR